MGNSPKKREREICIAKTRKTFNLIILKALYIEGNSSHVFSFHLLLHSLYFYALVRHKGNIWLGEPGENSRWQNLLEIGQREDKHSWNNITVPCNKKKTTGRPRLT